jgi:hypothetical protein
MLFKWKHHWQQVAQAHGCRDLTDAFVQLTACRDKARPRELNLERALSIANGFISRVVSSSQRGSDELPLEIANDALDTKQKIARALQNAEG